MIHCPRTVTAQRWEGFRFCPWEHMSPKSKPSVFSNTCECNDQTRGKPSPENCILESAALMFAVVLMHLTTFLEQLCSSSLHRVPARTSVNQNRFWELLGACQVDQKNQRMFKTSNSKSSTHLCAENYYNRIEPTANTPTPSISFPCCFDFQPKNLPFWRGK